MKAENLYELINRYEANLNMLYNETNDELFKWKAMKVWRDEWFKPESAFNSFADRFNAARREFSLFIDNSRVHPSAGVIKLWERAPDTVEHLFRDVLFRDSKGDISATQNNMDQFLEEYEALRQKHFPSSWSFKQDRHSASVFLAINDPTLHYVYKASEAQSMSKYIGFGLPIGSGSNFSLPNYYRLCDLIVEALKEHTSLLEKHMDRLTEDYYQDDSLHLLAFDLMYCCRSYGFYNGLEVPSTGKTIHRPKNSAPLDQEQQENLRAEKKRELEIQAEVIARRCEECCEISLIGVQVTAKPYGVGTVIAQNHNQIRVRFAETEKDYILHRRYIARPRFEDDETIIAAFTEYEDLQTQLKSLRRQIEMLK